VVPDGRRPGGAPDYYETLGVSRDASAETIRTVYRRLAQIYHPDVNTGNDAGGAKLAALNEAHATLSDPVRRARYDREFPIAGRANTAAPTSGAAGSGYRQASTAQPQTPRSAASWPPPSTPARSRRTAIYIALGCLAAALIAVAALHGLNHGGRHAPAPGTTTPPRRLAVKSVALGRPIVLLDSFGAHIAVRALALKPFPKATDDTGRHDLVGVRLRLVNKGSATINDDVGVCAELLDSAGAWHDEERSRLPGELAVFTLRPKATTQGWAVFALPPGRRAVAFTYTPSSDDSDAYGRWQFRPVQSP
jgi:DnaJ domain